MEKLFIRIISIPLVNIILSDKWEFSKLFTTKNILIMNFINEEIDIMKLKIYLGRLNL